MTQSETILAERVTEALRTIYDPELPVNIYDLGLIYGLETTAEGAVHIRMTLTTPACPVARSLPAQVEKKVRAVAGVTDVKLELVWDPPWSKARLSPAARLQLGLDDPTRTRVRRGFVPIETLQAQRKSESSGDNKPAE